MPSRTSFNTSANPPSYEEQTTTHPPSNNAKSCLNPTTQWSTTVNILERTPEHDGSSHGDTTHADRYNTTHFKQIVPNSSSSLDDNYTSFSDEYKVKTNFIRRIYTLLCLQLALTCAMCYVFYTVDSIKNYVLHTNGLLWTSIIMTFVFLIVGSPPCYGRHHPMNLIALLGFTLCESYVVGYTCLFYDSSLVIMACGITLSTFAGLTAYVMYTKKDFNFLGAGLYSCLWIIILGGFIALFLPNMPIFNVAMAILGCIVAVGYILYDTSEIINRMEIDEYVFACMSLYIDIIMLFVNLLQLLNGGKNDE